MEGEVPVRFDTKVELIHQEPGTYDPLTGNYAGVAEVSKTVWADVTDTGLQEKALIGGKAGEDSRTVRLQQKPDFQFEKVRIDGKLYQIDTVRRYRIRETLYVSRVKV